MYLNCQYVYHLADSDSIGTDSLDLENLEEYIERDEMGNPIQKPVETGEPGEINEEPVETPHAEATKPEND